MAFLDMRTAIFCHVLTDVVCAVVMAFLWYRNRRRFAGLSFWMAAFVMEVAGLILILLRGSIPDVMSMVLGNTLVVSGALAMYMGLQRFVGKTGLQVHNYSFLALFTLVHAYFALVQPSLAARTINFSVGILVFTFQCMWLLLRRVDIGMRPLTRGPGLVFAAYYLVSIVRVFSIFSGHRPQGELLESSGFDSMIVLTYAILFIAQTTSLILMVNRRLFKEMVSQEELFSKAFHSSPYAITLTSLSDGRILEVNECFVNITGYKPSEVIGKTALEMSLWATPEDRTDFVNEMMGSGRIHEKEFQFRKKSGEIISGLLWSNVITIKNEQCIIASISDITERKKTETELAKHREHLEELVKERTVRLEAVNTQLEAEICEHKLAEEALREKEEWHRTILQTAMDGFWFVDMHGHLLEVNDTYCRMSGYSIPELLTMRISDLEVAEAEDGTAAHIQKVLVQGEDRFQSRHRRKDGSIFEVEVSVQYQPTDDGRLVVFLRDITMRKVVEEERLQAAEEWRTTFVATNDAIWVLDKDQRMARSNKTAERYFQCTSDQMIGKHCWEVVHGTAEPIPECPILRARKSLHRESMELKIGDRWFEVTVDPLVDRVGQFGGAVHIVSDITERKRIVEALRQSERRYRETLENANFIAVELDRDGTILFSNKFLAELTGWEPSEISGKNWFDLFIAEDTKERIKEVHAENVASGKIFEQFENPIVTKNGEKREISWTNSRLLDESGGLIGVTSLGIDITDRRLAEEERRKLEEQLWQARKAESLGRMAGAIAHHYNNLLGAVLGNLELALDKLPRESKPGENIAQAMKASRRAADISHLMLAYLGQGIGKREPVDLSEVCRDSLPLLTATVPRKLRFKTQFPPSGPIIQGNAGQIKQVLSNLVTNAVEASGGADGDITVAVEVMPAANIPQSVIYPTGWRPKDESYACLSITDTGCGMDPETVDKIFDPFFSTKFTGRGLGLPVVAGIVKAHDGAVTVETAPGQGTVFRVFLPLALEQLLEPRKVAPAEPVSVEGRGFVLVAEDDPMLRTLAQTMLKTLGYKSIVAADGVEAVEVFGQRQDQIHCVLLDLTMPRMGGWETLETLREIRPGVRVILASGYDEAHVMGGEHPQLPQTFLQKPYTVDSLKAALAAVPRERQGQE